MALPLGAILDGKFKVVQVLGEGGMGTVYKVEQLGTPGYYYAVKELLINPNTTEEERKTAIERFTKEIDLLRKLKHPRIAGLVLPFQERGNYYFVMEFVPGHSLEKILEDANSSLLEDKVLAWGMQVCEALSYIHAQTPPIILRDLKPGNIMITTDGDVMLIDFGIARRFDPNKRTNTENLGTISYASPEHLGSIVAPGQKRSPKNPGQLVQTDARSDIYSLGATLYHVLTNYEPDPIQTPATGTILAKNPKLRTVKVGNNTVCPIEQVIIKAMQQLPAQRFQNADAMRMALQHCLPASASIGTVAATVQIPAMSPSATIYVQNTVSAMQATNVVCPKCGFSNRPGAKFCKRDGQPLAQGARSVPPQQVRTVPPPRAPIQARPVQQPIRSRPVQQSTQARPAQPIQARPVGSAVQSQQSIQARPVTRTAPPQPIRARPITGNGTAQTTTNDPNAAYRQGLQHLLNKKYVEAIAAFKLAQANGSSYDILYNLGRAYRQYGQSLKESDKKLSNENLKLAAEKLEEARGVKVDALDAYFQLGMCYRDLALYPLAVDAFKKALALAPQDPAIYYQLGICAIEQGYNREAEAYFLDGLRIAPDHTLILVALGRLYSDTRRYSDAAAALLQATQHDPMLWEAWLELGRVHIKEKKWQRALSALEQARQQHSTFSAEICIAMTTCYLRLGKKGEGRKLLNEVLQREPNNQEALKLQKQIN